MPYASHEEYFDTVSAGAGKLLRLIQSEVERVVPGAQRCIGYNMPAFRLRKIFFYFAAFKQHIGVYPPLRGDPTLIAELQDYRGPKGNLRFPLAKPLPLELIGRVASALAAEYHTK
jgi:uncharacterized protein YdhG (YjbR/CyaY superfamily)